MPSSNALVVKDAKRCNTHSTQRPRNMYSCMPFVFYYRPGGGGGDTPERPRMRFLLQCSCVSFATVLFPLCFIPQGNKQLKRHWQTWVTEEDIAQLATVGVNTIRLPVGDWMYQPYGPYVGCTDGALEEVDRLFDLCRRCLFFCFRCVWRWWRRWYVLPTTKNI